jgi:phosphatidylethanolamine/phosphatidyl-N-methylethanolamine N-methyltransferase
MEIAYSVFLRGLLQNPRLVSAPTPSSAVLAAAIAEQVDVCVPGLIVELGAGTGAVTAALAARGIAGHRIVAIEQDEHFASVLRTRFPAIYVHCGDALAFERYLPAGAQVAAVISGLPLLHMPKRTRRMLLHKALACSERFVQLSYSWRPPAPVEGGRILVTKRMIWRNFPPAHVWTYRALDSSADRLPPKDCGPSVPFGTEIADLT